MLWAMARSTGKKKKKEPEKVLPNGEKGRPRTVRLSHDDERWVDEQPEGFTAVVEEAVKLYREHKDAQRRQLLESVS